jgi:hypothetical protein
MNATGSDLLRGSSNNTARDIPSVGRFRTLKSKELMLHALTCCKAVPILQLVIHNVTALLVH